MTDARTFTINELVARWGCGRKTIIDAIRERKLNAFRVGKRTYRIAEAEVVRFEKATAP